jgi:phosphate/sulfate permease
MLGFVLALLLVLTVSWSFVRSTPFTVDKTFRVAQLGSAALYSLGHGGNDAQKTMGIIAGLLYAEGHLGSQFYVPLWVVLSCQAAMALGTYLGGWRIAMTMLPAMFQRTAETFRAAPTPMIAPVMVWVVDTGMPSQVARNNVIAPPISAQKPCIGLRRVMREPIVRTIGSSRCR